MEELKHNKTGLKKPLLITILYAAITLFCVFCHEIWADEAQVWMLCRHISFFDLFHHLTNEGHPSFFYLLVMPFAKLSPNIIWMQLICWGASVLSVFVFWRYSNFKTYLKWIVTFSAPFIYFFPVIARSYSIIPLLIFLLAAMHSKIKEHPYLYSFILIALLNTHAIMAFFCFLLALDFVWENIFLPYKKEKKFELKFIISALIMFIGALILFFQLKGTTSSNAFITFDKQGLGDFLRIIFLFIFNSLDAYYIKSHSEYFNNPILNAGIITYFLVFAGFLYSLFKLSKKYFAIFVLSSGFQILIYLLVYSNLILPTRVFVPHVILIYCFWMAMSENKNVSKKSANVLLAVFFALTLLNGIKSYYADIVFDYSTSKKTAKFIETNIDLENSMVFTDLTNESVAVNYYLQPKGIYSYYTGKPYKYVIWRKDLNFVPAYVWKYYLDNVAKENPNKDLYVLTCFTPFFKLSQKNDIWEGFELMYVSGDSLDWHEKFKLYKYQR